MSIISIRARVLSPSSDAMEVSVLRAVHASSVVEASSRCNSHRPDEPQIPSAMAGNSHAYDAHLVWIGNTGDGTSGYDRYSRAYRITIEGKPDLNGSADRAFRGDAAVHNPEDHFLAAISGCHMLSYLALCAREGVNVITYEDNARGNPSPVGRVRRVRTGDTAARRYRRRLQPGIAGDGASRQGRRMLLHRQLVSRSDRAQARCSLAVASREVDHV